MSGDSFTPKAHQGCKRAHRNLNPALTHSHNCHQSGVIALHIHVYVYMYVREYVWSLLRPTKSVHIIRGKWCSVDAPAKKKWVE